MTSVKDRLDTIVEDFSDLDSREKLQLLVDFANDLPPLPEKYAEQKTQNIGRVHECQTPVFLWMEAENGNARLIAEVAEEAPTVKGFVAILAEVISGQPLTDVSAISEDVLDKMGLADVLGMLRARGLRAILSRIKRGFAELLTT
ncbi:MAG: SufE family protein [Pirellulales bacterium]